MSSWCLSQTGVRVYMRPGSNFTCRAPNPHSHWFYFLDINTGECVYKNRVCLQKPNSLVGGVRVPVVLLDALVSLWESF